MQTKAVVIAGTKSGSGKTTVTLGVMAALKQLGHKVAPFKCGPDFIDPSLHKLVTGKTSRNLDLWMAGEQFSTEVFQRHAANGEISIIEGVMGMFDGGMSSSAALAKKLNIPVILVLDVSSAAESIAAVLKGFETLDPAVAPVGVILNKVASQRHLELVSSAITQYCHAEILGYLPRTTNFTIPSRHLGLHMGEESPITPDRIAELSQTVIDHINLRQLIELSTVDIPTVEQKTAQGEQKIRLAIARDSAFCFYYQENLDLFEKAGAELCFFSPLSDSNLPENIDAIYLGGGYPELYAKELNRNISMLEEINNWAEDNGPIYAECGGFMYLTKGIHTLENHYFPMADIFPVKAAMQNKRASLGYRELITLSPSFFGPKGTVLRGHEFHYSTIEPMDSSIEQIYRVDTSGEGYRYKNVVGGYLHLHFGFNPQAIDNFIHFCQGNQ